MARLPRQTVLLVVLACCGPAGWSGLAGQPAGGGQATTAPEGRMRLDLPENTEVKLLVDLVSRRLKLNILYDEALVKRRVTISAHAEIATDSLYGLLETVLKVSGLAIIDADQPGWKRIVAGQSLVELSERIEPDRAALASAAPAAVLTQQFELRFADTAAVVAAIKPWMSTPGGSSFTVVAGERRLLLVTDYAPNLRRVASLIDLLDRAGPRATTRFVPVRHLEAGELVRQVNELLREGQRVAGRKAGELALLAEPRGNQVVIVSADEELAGEALELIGRLDAPSGLQTRSYRFEHVSPQRVDKLARDYAGLLGGARGQYSSTADAESRLLIVTALPAVHEHVEQLVREFDVAANVQSRTFRFARVSPGRIDRLVREVVGQEGASAEYRSTVDEESGLLIATAPGWVHDRIERLASELDVEGVEPAMPIAFYKLTNTTASSVLATIQGLAGVEGGLAGLSGEAVQGPEPSGPPWVEAWVGPNRPPAGPGAPLPTPPAYSPSAPPASQPEQDGGDVRGGPARSGSALMREATVTVDVNTNTVIVVAPPGVQAVYRQLIRMLDKRRPQVLIEVILVTLDASDGFSLGVDLAAASFSGPRTRLLFSQFGLSSIDLATGELGIKPGIGFNGALIDPGTLSAVVRALASSGRAKVVSAPRVLVNDNATATLSSVNEAPFTSINASDTVATTSFAGYATAGTTLTVTPHISEGDHLQLIYSITLNSFTGEGGAGIPPPRQTNTIHSQVVVPDGHAVIVGGLGRQDHSRTASKVPLLGDIPLLGYAFGQRTRNRAETTLFAFIRPLILRDDQFEDLKYLSEQELRAAELPSNLPASGPLAMH